jgi:hypothetical protein
MARRLVNIRLQNCNNWFHLGILTRLGTTNSLRACKRRFPVSRQYCDASLDCPPFRSHRIPGSLYNAKIQWTGFFSPRSVNHPSSQFLVRTQHASFHVDGVTVVPTGSEVLSLSRQEAFEVRIPGLWSSQSLRAAKLLVAAFASGQTTRKQNQRVCLCLALLGVPPPSAFFHHQPGHPTTLSIRFLDCCFDF